MLYTVQVFFNLHFLYESIQILFYFYCTGQTFLTFLIIFWIGKFKFRRRNFFFYYKMIWIFNSWIRKSWRCEKKNFYAEKSENGAEFSWMYEYEFYCTVMNLISRVEKQIVIFFSFPYICKIECTMCILYDMFYDHDIEKYWEIPRFFLYSCVQKLTFWFVLCSCACICIRFGYLDRFLGNKWIEWDEKIVWWPSPDQTWPVTYKKKTLTLREERREKIVNWSHTPLSLSAPYKFPSNSPNRPINEL